ncbi:hypothetical protein MMC31_000049 [Peltigera leucophlebia]|nr:hypothetical protein [Peltigera leucophlebia]
MAPEKAEIMHQGNDQPPAYSEHNETHGTGNQASGGVQATRGIITDVFFDFDIIKVVIVGTVLVIIAINDSVDATARTIIAFIDCLTALTLSTVTMILPSDSQATHISLWLTVGATAICILELVHLFYTKILDLWRRRGARQQQEVDKRNAARRVTEAEARLVVQTEISKALRDELEAVKLQRRRTTDEETLRANRRIEEVDALANKRVAEVEAVANRRVAEVEALADRRVAEVEGLANKRITEIEALWDERKAAYEDYHDQLQDITGYHDNWQAAQEEFFQKLLNAQSKHWDERKAAYEDYHDQLQDITGYHDNWVKQADARLDQWIEKWGTQQAAQEEFFQKLLNAQSKQVEEKVHQRPSPAAAENASSRVRGLFQNFVVPAGFPARPISLPDEQLD